jgi:hypothetical protein
MNFDELKNMWTSMDADLEQNLTVNQLLLKDFSIQKIKSHLYELKWTAWIEIIVSLLFFSFLADFIGRHLSEMKFLIPAIAIWALTLSQLIYGIYTLYHFYSLNSGDTVLKTQKNLERLKYLELLDTRLLLIIIPIFSGPFLIVLGKALIGFDAYQLGNYLISYFLGSIVIAMIIVYVMKKFPDKSIDESIDFLKNLKEIENEKI